MNNFLYLLSKYRGAIIAFVVAIVVALIVFNVLIFRVSGYEPNQNSVPTSARVLRVSFTQPVKTVDKILLDGTEVGDDQIKIDGNSVIISLTESLTDGRLTKLELLNISSRWFGFSLKNTVMEFIPKYIPFNRLSDEQKKAAIDASDSNQSDDPFLNNNFPLRGEGYSIEASKGYSDKQIFVGVTFYADIPDYDVSEQAVGLSDSDAEKMRLRVLEMIKKYKGTPEDYIIRYSNEYLNDKYLPFEAEHEHGV